MYIERRLENLEDIRDFLNSLKIKMPKNIEYTVGIYDNERLIGMGSLSKNVLKGIGIDHEYQGEGVLAQIITHLVKKALEMDMDELYLFTKIQEAEKFRSLGFKKVAEVKPYVAFLEWTHRGIEKFKENLRDIAKDKPHDASSIVVNCNPFTLGHLYLMEAAAKESSWLYVIVVEEDVSVFPYEARIDMLKKGTEHIKNLTIVPGGRYVISLLTFPSYFTRKEDLAKAQISLDLEIFRKHIAPSLKVKQRYVGKEPYCPITAQYNELMKKTLGQEGIEVIELQRLEVNGKPVSASLVRDLIMDGKINEAKKLIPRTTYKYIVSPEGKKIMEVMKKASQGIKEARK